MQLDNHTATYAPRKWTKQSVSASLEYVNAAEKRIQIFCISKGKSWDRDVDKETAFVDKWSYLRSLFSPIMGRNVIIRENWKILGIEPIFDRLIQFVENMWRRVTE